jgi:transposase
MVLLWGEDGIILYNDAYSALGGGGHTGLLGSKVREVWPEVADFNDNVMRVGLAGGMLSYRDQELTLHRNGVPERVWMDLSYSPVPDESGPPVGVTNKGELRRMVLNGAITAPDLLRFVTRLIRDAAQQVFPILDRLPVHRSAKVHVWLAGREAEIEVFHLPGYSPELNPDEGVNGDLNQAVNRKRPACSKAQLKRATIGHMRRMSKRPDHVRSIFARKTFRCAA